MHCSYDYFRPNYPSRILFLRIQCPGNMESNYYNNLWLYNFTRNNYLSIPHNIFNRNIKESFLDQADVRHVSG